jgi:hypothetical protein
MLNDAGQAGARIAFCDVPAEMIEAATWVVENSVGEVSQVTLVEQLLEAVLNAAPLSVRKEICKYPKRTPKASSTRTRPSECHLG